MAGIVFLGRYEAMRLLGEGGMARVHLARQVDGGQLAAVKVLHQRYAGVPRYREAFGREIEFLGRIRHPGAVALYDSSMTDPQGPCFAMEYVDGIPVDDLIRRHGPLDPERVGRLLGQICAVLHAMHGQGIVHRDLKPANVMVVDADSAGERIKILDFGLAGRAPINSSGVYIAPEKLTSHTANAGFGTPEYSCPHQLRGKDVDHRADLYSLGVIAYELLTGHRPFGASAVREMMEAGDHRPPPPMARRGGGLVISRMVETVVQACLAGDPADRPQSARDLAELYGAAIGKNLWDLADPPPLAAVAALPVLEAAGSPHATVYHLEAWMPEQIAVVKLRGFLKDIGGEVVESVPGLIRVRLKRYRQPIAPAPAPALWSRLGLGKKTEPVPEFDPVDMDVLIEKPALDTRGRVLISIRLSPAADGTIETGDAWRSWCDHIHADLSAYLMAKRN